MSAQAPDVAPDMTPDSIAPSQIRQTRRRLRGRPLRHTLRPLALLCILLAAALFRLSDLNWDQSQHLHPDERHVSNVLSGLRLPDGVAQYFDSGQSPLNPYNIRQSWVYGTLPLFLDRWLAELLDQGCQPDRAPIPHALGQFIVGGDAADCNKGFFTSYDPLTLAGRFLSALADVITVFFVYLLGRRLFGWRVGLLASAFSALSVLQIQHAHFAVVESLLTLCVTVCLYFCARVATIDLPSQAKSWRFWINAALAGAFSGLAVACKISAWPAAAMVVLAIVIALMRDRRRMHVAIVSAFVATLIAGAASFLTFRIVQPYAFVGGSQLEWLYTTQQCASLTNPEQVEICLRQKPLPQTLNRIAQGLPAPLRAILAPSSRWIAELESAAAQSSGEWDPPFGWQWANRTPIIFPLLNIVFHGLGVTLGISAVIGVLYMWRQLLRGRRWYAYLIPALWTTGFFLYQGTQFVKSIRYQLPIYPVLCVAAAVALVALWRAAGRSTADNRRQSMLRTLSTHRLSSAVPIAIVLAGTFAWALAFSQIYSRDITRVQASRWIYENVPTAITLNGSAGTQVRQFQLPMQQLDLLPDGQQTFTFRLDKRDDRLDSALSNVRFSLNHVTGSGTVEARLIDAGANQTLQMTQRRIDESNSTLDFGRASLTPGATYALELRLLDGPGVSARTSVIANQHWDEGGPVRLGGKDGFGSYYRGLSSIPGGEMQVYAEEDPYIDPQNPGKLEWMLRGLDEADTLVLFSNRHYPSVARLPWRFPMTNEYYRALFAGELGFELAADFNSFPRIGPFVFNDQEMPFTLARAADTQGTPPGIEIPYPTAEEAFAVYDHPRVMIFKKTGDYSRANAERILGAYDPTRTIKRTTFQSSNTPRGMLFDQKTWEAQQAGGTWSELFPRSSPLNQSQPLAVLAWLVLMELLGLAAFPILAATTRIKTRDPSPFVLRQAQDAQSDSEQAGRWTADESRRSSVVDRPSLIDGGYSFAKMLGLLLVAFIAWWLASVKIAPFAPSVLWALVSLLVIAGGVIAYRNREELVRFVRARWPILLASELLFLCAFAFFLLVRIGNPDLWHPYMGGEKPMDLAYLNGVLKSTYFPPIDPWFADGYINYYYFGFVVVGWPIKALGIDPAVAYNIVIPTLFALTACGAFGLGATLYSRRDRKYTTEDTERAKEDSVISVRSVASMKRALIAGLLAALFVVGIGNGGQIDVVGSAWQKLGGVEQGVAAPVAFVDGFIKWLGGAPMPIASNWPYWNATRLTAGQPADAVPIAEFPQFTFLYADLHAHMIAMPIAYLALAFALAFAAGVRRWPALVLGAAVVGSLWATNTWDYPPYLLLMLAGLVISALTNSQQPITNQRSLQSAPRRLLGVLPALIVFVVLTRLFWVPYLENYGAAYNNIDLWQNERTPLKTYITVYGLFLIPLTFYLLWNVLSEAPFNKRLSQIALAIGVIVGLFFALRGVPIAFIAAPMTLLALAAALFTKTQPQTRLAWLMTAGGFAVTLFVELFVLRGDIGRMNTVFKFYIQAWLLLGVTAAVTLMWVIDRIAQAREATAREATAREATAREATGVEPEMSGTVRAAASTLGLTSNPSGLSGLSIIKHGLVIAVGLALFLALLYPVFAIPAKVNDRYVKEAPRGLDGMAYMKLATHQGFCADEQADFPLVYDYDAIRWMQDNVKGSPTIFEGTTGGRQYCWGSRYAIYTGLPSVIGWQWHQRQQRAALDDRIVYDRDEDVTALYSAPDIEVARKMIRRYKPGYIIVGPLERATYDAAGLEKFGAMVESGDLRVAYENPGVTIYQVVQR